MSIQAGATGGGGQIDSTDMDRMMPTKPLTNSFILIFLAFLTTNVFSAVFNVSNTPQLRQALLDAALNGQEDWIVLAAGVYRTTSDGLGTFRFSDSEPFDLTIMGQNGLSRNEVILSGEGVNQVLSVLNSTKSTLALGTLTLSFGYGFNECGGGLHSDFDVIYITDVDVVDNAANRGGGICVRGGDTGNTLIGYSRITGNRGSGVYFEGDTFFLDKVVISDNKDIVDGGGLNLNVSGNVHIRRSTIQNNEGGWGGGIHYSGIGVQMISVDKTLIVDNTTTSSGGGGVTLKGGILSGDPLTAIITNSVIARNTAQQGGGVNALLYVDLIIVNTTISDNYASSYGGIAPGWHDGTFVNNILYRNTAGDVGYGGTFYNNYIDYWQLDPSALLKDNILPLAGDQNFTDAEYRIVAGSVVIDQGLDPYSDTFADLIPNGMLLFIRDRLRADKDEQPRVIGSAIDMGAYEYDPNYSPPVDLSGTIKTADGTDICAMVLASGQFTFSCNPPGVFSLTNLPSESDGTVKRQIYADGFFPEVDTLPGSSVDAVAMTRSGNCPNYNTPYLPADGPGSAGKRIDISGKVLLQNTQTQICAMVLANGQYVFSCDGSGSYATNIPLDNNGQFKLQVYADGFAPVTQTFDEFQVVNDVRMARAAECQ